MINIFNKKSYKIYLNKLFLEIHKFYFTVNKFKSKAKERKKERERLLGN